VWCLLTAKSGATRATTPTSMRLDPDVKAALGRAAEDDDRSVSSLIQRVLKAWLAEHGYLPRSGGRPGTPARGSRPRRPSR
jgi:hypothetical protein